MLSTSPSKTVAAVSTAPELRRQNICLGLVLLSIALVFFLGLMAKMAYLHW